VPVHAQVIVTEVAPWSSGNSPLARDRFELTNIGSGAVSIAGWTMDDDSALANSASLSGVTTIGAGESVVFIERAAADMAATLVSNFINIWFGGSAPSGLQIGTYLQGVAGGVGLSATADSVTIYSGTEGTLQTNVSFGGSDAVTPFQTFDNAAGLSGAISALSIAGVNGAFTVASGNEIGSPGVAPVPEPETYAMLLAGSGLVGFVARRRRQAAVVNRPAKMAPHSRASRSQWQRHRCKFSMQFA
jgi:Lamin Tail Domain/PEP-CTERM motif